jgi:hypothetical protein
MPRTSRNPLKPNSEIAVEPDYISDDEMAGDLVLDDWGVPLVAQHSAKDRKTKKRSLTKAESDETAKRLDEIRMSLALSRNPVDILRGCANRWGISTLSVRAYLSIARKMNAQILKLTPEQAKADSTSFWSAEMQKLMLDTAKADRMIDQAQEMLNKAKESITLAIKTSDPDKITDARDAAMEARKLLAAGRAMKESALSRGYNVRHTLDRILGTHAPIKIEQKVEGSIEVTAKTEPMSLADMAKTIATAIVENPDLESDIWRFVGELKGTVIQGELASS